MLTVEKFEGGHFRLGPVSEHLVAP